MGRVRSLVKVRPPRADFGYRSGVFRSESLAAFRSRDFRVFQVARFLSTIATQAQSVAVGWRVYEITHEPLDLGFVGLAQFLPAFLLSLVTGHVADRYDRRRVVMVCGVAMAACSALLLWLAHIGNESTLAIYGVLLLFGTARAFQRAAGSAFLPHTVPPEHFQNAVVWGSTMWQIATIAGPAVGGLLYWLGGGAPFVYAAAAVLYGFAFVFDLANGVRLGRMEKKAVTWSTLLAGVRYVLENRIVLGAITLDLFAVLLGGAVALLPVFAKDILHVGPLGLGALRSAPAVGASLMAIVLAWRPLTRRAGRTLYICVFVFGLSTIVFGLSEWFLLSFFALVVGGAVDMVSIVIRQTLVQTATPPEMRGRVSAVNVAFIVASNELGEFESGVTAAWLGTVPAVLLGGVGTCGVVVACAFLFPQLRRVDRLGGP